VTLTDPYFIEHRFRCVTAEQIGTIQALALDDSKWTRERLARRFGISEATVAKIVKAVPRHLITVHRKATASRRRLRRVS
jgi:AraC-like DNA-binding protein